jgi:hypothetical protein
MARDMASSAGARREALDRLVGQLRQLQLANVRQDVQVDVLPVLRQGAALD